MNYITKFQFTDQHYFNLCDCISDSWSSNENEQKTFTLHLSKEVKQSQKLSFLVKWIVRLPH